jgi:predicted DNA-binding mobile mystery protein A
MRQLSRNRLDERASTLREVPASAKTSPHGGWIRAIREALGMPRRALANRMHVGEKRVQQMELGEARGSITVSTLSRAAEALNCDLVVAFVPKVALETQVQQRRLQLAQDWIASRMLHTMSLEGQVLGYKDLPQAAIQEVEKMFPDERLWETS